MIADISTATSTAAVVARAQDERDWMPVAGGREGFSLIVEEGKMIQKENSDANLIQIHGQGARSCFLFSKRI